MSNNNYTVNKYTESILDGLGYAVIHGYGFQDVAALYDKEKSEYLPYETLDFSEEEWSSGIAQRLGGVSANVFNGNNGERIFFDEFGNTEICFKGNLSINISRFDEKFELMNITVKYGNEGEKGVTFFFAGYEGTRELLTSNGIYVEDSERSSERITYITNRCTEWGNNNNTYPAESCTTANIINHIIKSLRRYKHGYYWDDELKYGLEVIGPALDIYAMDFQTDWIKYLDEIVEKEKESQRESRKAINDHITIISNSKVREKELRDAKSSLLTDPDVKKLYKRRNETKD